MKILFTGASSYIALWIIKELKEAGHEVVGTFQKQLNEYEGLKGERVKEVINYCTPVDGLSFGDEKFIALIKQTKWDLFCHHAADATNPRSPDFDWVNALKKNTNNLAPVLDELKSGGCTHILLTGSVYEMDVGAGSEPRYAVSPYGLSKGLTWQVFRHFCHVKDISLGKFVIPLSFGPYEDPKMVSYLVQSWLKGEIPTVKTPRYIRDNIHVTLLAKAYRKYAEEIVSTKGIFVFSPSGYIKTQGEFARNVSEEMEKRLHIPCPINYSEQTEFPEPKIRVNTESLNPVELGWDEKKAWDDLAEYFLSHIGNNNEK